MTNKELWAHFHSMWAAAKSSSAYSKGDWIALQAALLEREQQAGIPQISVCAYVPANEEHPVLLLCSGMEILGTVWRRGEYMYDRLLHLCGRSPKWLFDQEPVPL